MSGETPKVETPNQAPGTVPDPAAIGTDDLSAAGADIGAALDQNEKVSPVTDTKPNPGKAPAWRSEPVSNFKLDPDGKVVMRSNGSPVRRGGKPARPKAGDTLADGTTYGVGSGGKASGGKASGAERVGVSRVVMPPADPGPGGPGPGDPGGGDRQVQAGPEFGRTLAKTAFNVATKRGGDKWKPSPDETELIEGAAGQTFAGRRVPWFVALVVGLVGYVVARVEFKRQDETGAATDGDHAHLHNRADTKRQDTVSPAVGGGGGPF